MLINLKPIRFLTNIIFGGQNTIKVPNNNYICNAHLSPVICCPDQPETSSIIGNTGRHLPLNVGHAPYSHNLTAQREHAAAMRNSVKEAQNSPLKSQQCSQSVPLIADVNAFWQRTTRNIPNIRTSEQPLNVTSDDL